MEKPGPSPCILTILSGLIANIDWEEAYVGVWKVKKKGDK